MAPSPSTPDSVTLRAHGAGLWAHGFRAALVVLVLSGCWGGVPDTVGPQDGDLAPCPATQNCVHTGLRHPDGTSGFFMDGALSRSEGMSRLRGVIDAMPRTTIVTERPGYLHAEVRSRVFRFVDDLEVLLMPDGELVVRSASRVGKSDLGVNAERVESLRISLTEAGVIR